MHLVSAFVGREHVKFCLTHTRLYYASICSELHDCVVLGKCSAVKTRLHLSWEPCLKTDSFFVACFEQAGEDLCIVVEPTLLL